MSRSAMRCHRLRPQGRRGRGRTFLHRGIATRAFERRFTLADHVRVEGANHQDGMLNIDLVREIPEALKPRRIEIAKAAKAVEKLDA